MGLEAGLSAPQQRRIARAFGTAGADAVAAYRTVLLGLIDDADRGQVAARLEAPLAVAPAPADQSPHILVVDDDTRLRQLLHRYLSDNGYRVTTATGAADARRHLDGLRFDLIVLDVMMPEEDGIHLRRGAAAHLRCPYPAVDGEGEAEDRIAGLEAGADDYLPKPFEPRELLLRIEAVLRRAARPEEAASIALGEHVFDVKRGTLSATGRRSA